MQWEILGWILNNNKSISGKTGEIQLKGPLVNDLKSIVIYQCKRILPT